MKHVNFSWRKFIFQIWLRIFLKNCIKHISSFSLLRNIFDALFQKNPNSNFENVFPSRKINNFHKLFPIIVEYPFLRPYTDYLSNLPLPTLYTWLYFAFYGYKYIVQSSFKGILKNIIHYLIIYFKYVTKYFSYNRYSST